MTFTLSIIEGTLNIIVQVSSVRAATADAAPPTYTPAPAGCSLPALCAMTTADVTAAIRKLPDKQCAADRLPTRLLKDNVDLLSPFVTALFNKSVTSGICPAAFKTAVITPRLKKTSLEPAEPQSYRPVLSKTLERLVARQLVAHLILWKLMPELQSAYRANHSTETAVLRVLADILGALDRGDYAVLTLLDLSAAFDTVDHATLLRRLQITYGISGTALSWFSSYRKKAASPVQRHEVFTTLHILWSSSGVGLRPDPFLTIHS